MAILTQRTPYRWGVKPPLGVRVDWRNPITAGLVEAFLLNEGGARVYGLAGGRAADLLSYGSNLNWATGPNGPVLKEALHNAAELRIDNARPIILTGNARTISAWMYRLTADAQGTALCAGLNYGEGYWFLYSSGTYYINWGNYYYTFPNTLLPVGAWYHYVVIKDGTQHRLYRNGALIHSATVAGGNPQSVIRGFGRIYSNYAEYYASLSGYLDVPMAWERALTEGEVRQLYTDPFCWVAPPITRVLAAPTGGQQIALSGSAAGTAGLAAAFGRLRPVAGASGGAAVPAGALARLRALAGTAPGIAIPAGVIGRLRPLAGAAAGAAAVQGFVTSAKLVLFSGACAGTAAVAGALVRLRGLAGAAAGEAAATGTVRRKRGLGGTAAAGATASGAIARLRGLAGQAAGAAAVSGWVARWRGLAGLAQGLAAVMGRLAIFGSGAAAARQSFHVLPESRVFTVAPEGRSWRA